MKKILLSAVALLAALSVQGQGTVNFANFGAGWLTSQFKDVGGANLAGSFSVELLAGATSGSLASVTIATATFTSGYFNAGVVTIPGLTGNGFAQVRVWDNAGGTITSFAAAVSAGRKVGDTASFAVTGLAAPPAPPVLMNQMPGVTLQVIPEPSTIALGLIGAVGAFMLRRRK